MIVDGMLGGMFVSIVVGIVVCIVVEMGAGTSTGMDAAGFSGAKTKTSNV